MFSILLNNCLSKSPNGSKKKLVSWNRLSAISTADTNNSNAEIYNLKAITPDNDNEFINEILINIKNPSLEIMTALKIYFTNNKL